MGRFLLMAVVLSVSAGLTSPSVAGAQDDEACLSCHGAEGLSLTFPSKETLSVTVDPKTLKGSVHAGIGCASCHAGNVAYPHPKVASRTLRDFRLEKAQVCGTCHPEVAETFAASIHGQGLRMGFADVPTCTSCHGAHDVGRASAPAFRNDTPQLCGTCHGDARIMAKYGLRPVYQTYSAEFHGVTTTLYRLTKPESPTPAAICYDCHGVHDIKAAADPTSRVAPASLLATCRTCHPQAGRFFASAWTEHRTPSSTASPLVYYVQLFYRVLIPSVVGFLAMLTVLDLGHWAGGRLRRIGGGTEGRP